MSSLINHARLLLRVFNVTMLTLCILEMRRFASLEREAAEGRRAESAAHPAADPRTKSAESAATRLGQPGEYIETQFSATC
jgi:hypothetical protein